MFIVAVFHFVISFVSVPKVCIVIRELLWQWSHASAGFIYILLNKSIKGEIGKMVSKNKISIIYKNT
uniref:Secreted protein n=1 Tax=Rhabditophanes sp. KR3021 TaxID=114890 RepID=A0AC35UDB4_9BILA